MNVLVINTGSTSVKVDVFEFDSNHCQRIFSAGAQPHEGFTLLDRVLNEHPLIDVVAHRVVHGGEKLRSVCLLNEQSKKIIEELSALAPLHNPVALRWIQASEERFAVPQFALCDTGFFSDLPDVAKYYAVPKQWTQELGICRYGFHGIAHEDMWRFWAQKHPKMSGGGRVITLQLGGGCSMAAIENGRALDTSMGFSPAEGLVMATRCGDIDIEAALHVMQSQELSVEALRESLNSQSGLLGVSNKSGDMRDLTGSSDADADYAIRLFCYRVKKYLGAYMAVLGGVDGIVFGGGVSEHQSQIRANILQGMAWFGIELCETANAALDSLEGKISTDTSKVEVWVTQVDENQLIANKARDFFYSIAT